MAIRLFSDLLSGAGQRFFYDLEGSPGVISPGVATLTLSGQQPQYPGTVFRTPATLTLTLNGRQVNPDAPLRPAQAALAFANSVVGLQTIRLVQPTLPSPVENPDNVFVPTLIQVFHKEPGLGLVQVLGLQPSVSEGGDIGFRSPGVAALTLIGYPYLRSIPPVDGQAQPMVLGGLQPTLTTTLVIEPEPGLLSFLTLDVITDKGFVWIDDAPSPPITWS